MPYEKLMRQKKGKNKKEKSVELAGYEPVTPTLMMKTL